MGRLARRQAEAVLKPVLKELKGIGVEKETALQFLSHARPEDVKLLYLAEKLGLK